MKKLLILFLFLISARLTAQEIKFERAWPGWLVGSYVNTQALFSDGDKLRAGTIGKGMLVSNDLGNNWLQIGSDDGFYDSEVHDFVADDSGWIFAGSYPKGIYRSKDGGIKWESLFGKPGLPDSLGWLWVPSLAVTDSGLFITTAGYGVFKSTDGGESWQAKSQGLVKAPEGYYYITRSLVVNYKGEMFVIAGGDWGFDSKRGIFKSTDNGETWTRAHNGIPTGAPLKRIVAAPNGYLYVGTGWMPYGGIYRSKDDGLNWEKVLDERISFWGLAVDVNGYVYAGSRAGELYRSKDNGDTWELVAVPAYDIQEIAFHQGYIFLGTSDGVFRSTELVITSVEPLVSELPQYFQLRQSYPNPFNPLTTIEFSISKAEFVTLKIFNVLGEKVATLVEEELAAGSYRFNWQADNLPSGIYFYRLQTNEFVETKKMVLLK